MPSRREHILGFDRMHGIEIADLADRLVDIWPTTSAERDAIAEARTHVDALERSVAQMTRIVLDLRAELSRIEVGELPR